MALLMPDKKALPVEMSEAALLVETGWSPTELEQAPENLIQTIMLYKAIKNVAEYGGTLKL